MSFIELENVYKRYRMGDITIEASSGMSFEIEQGELAIIVGPSGSGKTTILNILGGMDTCDEGRIMLDESILTKAHITKEVCLAGMNSTFEIWNPKHRDEWLGESTPEDDINLLEDLGI